jgi:hypothetical protein
MRNHEPFCHTLPVSPQSFHTALYVTNAGWERILPGQPYPQPKPAVYFFTWEEGRELPEFCLALCLRGTGVFQTKTGCQQIRAGDAFLMRPGEWHRHRPAKTVGWTLLWFDFNGELPHRWMAEGAFSLNGNHSYYGEMETVVIDHAWHGDAALLFRTSYPGCGKRLGHDLFSR